MKIFLLLVLLLFSYGGHAQESFKIPDNPSVTASTYLEKLKIKDASRQLSEREKHDLCRLFVKAFVISVRKQGQDNFIMTNAAIYRLLAVNFPEIRVREAESGSIIFLGAIASFFNRMPEYRGDVLQVLRQGINWKNCGR